jgi:hypothetical protein
MDPPFVGDAIGIGEGDDPALCLVDPGITGRVGARTGFLKDADATRRPEHPERAVGRSVVHEDQLHRSVAGILAFERGDALGERALCVADGDHHGDHGQRQPGVFAQSVFRHVKPSS